MNNIYDEIRKEFNETVTPTVRNLANKIKADLYYGPLYLTREGEETCVFEDDYHHQFDLTRACEILKNWIERKFPTLYYEMDSGCFSTRRPEGEWICEECFEYECDEGCNCNSEKVWQDPEPYWELSNQNICEALFGIVIASHIYR